MRPNVLRLAVPRLRHAFGVLRRGSPFVPPGSHPFARRCQRAPFIRHSHLTFFGGPDLDPETEPNQIWEGPQCSQRATFLFREVVKKGSTRPDFMMFFLQDSFGSSLLIVRFPFLTCCGQTWILTLHETRGEGMPASQNRRVDKHSYSRLEHRGVCVAGTR